MRIVIAACIAALGFGAAFYGSAGGGQVGAPLSALMAPASGEKKGAMAGPAYSESAFDITPLDKARIEQLAASLTPEEARILLKKGTEPAFCGNLLDNKMQGVYCCKLCGLPLFTSDNKFDSGTGWPSFYQPFDKDHIRYEKDVSYGMVRVEILCVRCNGHLGHVFDDGPEPTGLRYCLNSASLNFYEKGTEFPPESRPIKTEIAYFGGGCFWGIEDQFQRVPGVIRAVSGYQGGHVDQPTYEQVCTGETGHAEVVQVVYDPSRVTYRQLLETFFKIHDPTQLNRQGPDWGTQYRSAIFAADEKQLAQAQAFIQEQGASNPRFSRRKIVTQVELAKPFFEAEAYHQDYNARHGRSCPAPLE